MACGPTGAEKETPLIMSEQESSESFRRRVLLAACLAGFVTPLLSTMMNLTLVSIGEEFDVGSHDLAYLNTAFLLSAVMFMVPLAKLADIHGKRLTFMAGLLVTIISCILAAVGQSFIWLVACRVIMGAGTAALASSSISLIVDTHPPEVRGTALSYQTTCTYAGLALGPFIGGFVNDLFGWRVVFLVVIAPAIASILCMYSVKTEVAPDRGAKFDSNGTVLYCLGIVLAMWGVMSLPELWAVAMLVVGVVLIAAFALWERRIENSLLNVHLFRSRMFTGSNVAAFLNYAASYSISYFMALYLESIGELTASEAGILMLVQAAVQAILTPVFGRLSDRVRDKRILPTAGMVITAVGVATFMLYGTEMNVYLVLATMLIVGFGNGIFSTPNTSVVMGSVPKERTSEASATLSVMRQAGMMVSMGIAMMFISIIMGSTDNLVPENYGLFVDVIQVSFLVCTVMCLAGAVVSALRGRGERARHAYLLATRSVTRCRTSSTSETGSRSSSKPKENSSPARSPRRSSRACPAGSGAWRSGEGSWPW